MKKVIACLSLFGLITSCTSGSSASISSSVTSGSCTNMKTGIYCTITVDYNTNGATNLALTYQPNPLESGFVTNSSFVNEFNTCAQNILSATTSGTCAITINYTTVGQDESQSLIFSLGGQSTKPIAISGN